MMKKNNLYIIGLLLAIVSLIVLNMDSLFYPKIEDRYQRCDSICIRDDGTLPCNCKEIIEKKPTTPLWYVLVFIALIIIGLIIMFKGWKDKVT